MRLKSHHLRSLRFEALESRLMLSITVNTLVDESDGVAVGGISLRDAIAAATPGDTIDFSVTGTITLTHGELLINKNLTIRGPGANLLTIDASGDDPTPGSTLEDGDDQNDGDGSRVFQIEAAAGNVGIIGVSLTGGDVVGRGGAILSFANLTLEDCAIRENSARDDGGGLFASIDGGDISIRNVMFLDNEAGQGGGGVRIDANNGSHVVLQDSRVAGNHGTDYGGGAELRADGSTIVLERMDIVNNSIDHIGGGVRTLLEGGSSIAINDSLVANNSAVDFGGGMHFTAGSGEMIVSNSTVSRNDAGTDGGGINVAAHVDGHVSIEHTTIVENRTVNSETNGTAGLKLFSGAATVTDTIIAKNQDSGGYDSDLGVEPNPQLQDPITPGLIPGSLTLMYSLIGFNVEQGLLETGLDSPDSNGNFIGGTTDGAIDPLLGPLADNGGPTFTQALLPGSPAINSGDPDAVASIEGPVPQFDQRGAPFGRVSDGRIDIGAFEDSAVRNNPGFIQGGALDPNDDGSTSPASIGFDINFFGSIYSQLFVNNNGNVTFDQALSTFTPSSLLAIAQVIIAPFWADVDTRGIGSVTYGQDIVEGHAAFAVNWSNVGYFSSHTDKTNTFQLVLIDRSDIAPGDFDFEFNYLSLQWETGDASSGTNGLGGSSARIGYSNGSTTSFELPGSDMDGAFPNDNPATGLIYYSRDSSVPGRYSFQVRNGEVGPTGPTALDDIVSTPFGQPITIDALANDRASEGLLDPTSVTIVDRPAHGVVTIDPITGAITFTPTSLVGGEDRFTYTVRDQNGNVSNLATVTITVTATAQLPDPPVPIPQAGPLVDALPLPPLAAQPSLLLIPRPLISIVVTRAEPGAGGGVPRNQGIGLSVGSPQAIDAALATGDVDQAVVLANFLDFVDPEMLVVDLGDEPPQQIAADASKTAATQAAPQDNAQTAGFADHSETGVIADVRMKPVDHSEDTASTGGSASTIPDLFINHWKWFASFVAILLLGAAGWKGRYTWMQFARKLRSR